MIYEFGEERRSRRIARAIVRARRIAAQPMRRAPGSVPEMKPKKQDKPKKKLAPMRPERPQPEVHQQINYEVGRRLARGFSILRGGDV